MACSNKNCSRCGCRCGAHARVNYPDTSTCADRKKNCGCGSSCGSSCGCHSGSCGCNSNCGVYPPWRPWIPAENTAVAAAANNNGFGLLRTLPDYAAYRRCWQDGPFYNGPCGPCEDSCCDHGCDHGCHHGCHGCCDHGCYPPPMPLPPMPLPPTPDLPDCPYNSTFIAGAPVSLAAGDNITLSSISTDTPGFIPTTGGIRIQNAGTYMVFYTVQIPAGEPINTRLMLTLDGGNIASSAVDVVTEATDGTTAYTMQAIIQAGDNSLLNLVTQGPLAISSASSANLVTLSILQIC